MTQKAIAADQGILSGGTACVGVNVFGAARTLHSDPKVDQITVQQPRLDPVVSGREGGTAYIGQPVRAARKGQHAYGEQPAQLLGRDRGGFARLGVGRQFRHQLTGTRDRVRQIEIGHRVHECPAAQFLCLQPLHIVLRHFVDTA